MTSRLRLLRFYQILLAHFGQRHWWPADSNWEMMVGAILTQNTAWTNVEKAIGALRDAGALTLEKVAALPRRRLERLIRSSGYFRQKAERLQSFARYLQKNPEFYQHLRGQHHSGRKRGEAFDSLRERLLALKGIGPETADSILLYAGGYPIFVVDAYTRRIGQRVGLFKYNDYYDVQKYFERALPLDAPLFNEFHAQLVMLAKHFCLRRNPRCTDCPVVSLCAYGRRRIHR